MKKVFEWHKQTNTVLHLGSLPIYQTFTDIFNMNTGPSLGMRKKKVCIEDVRDCETDITSWFMESLNGISWKQSQTAAYKKWTVFI